MPAIRSVSPSRPALRGRHARPQPRGNSSAIVVLLVVLGSVGVVGVLLSGRTGDPAPALSTLRPPDSGSVGDGAGMGDRRGDSPRPLQPGGRESDSTAARRLLRGWDERRAAAYADGSIRALRRLYVPSSVAGRRDVGLLGDYLRRGYHVEGMRTQLLALEVVDRRRGRWVLRVTDRLHSAVAVRRDQRAWLPADGVSARMVVFARDRSGWRVAAVRDVA